MYHHRETRLIKDRCGTQSGLDSLPVTMIPSWVHLVCKGEILTEPLQHRSDFIWTAVSMIARSLWWLLRRRPNAWASNPMFGDCNHQWQASVQTLQKCSIVECGKPPGATKKRDPVAVTIWGYSESRNEFSGDIPIQTGFFRLWSLLHMQLNLGFTSSKPWFWAAYSKRKFFGSHSPRPLYGETEPN